MILRRHMALYCWLFHRRYWEWRYPRRAKPYRACALCECVRPPYDAQTLNAIKSEFRRLRDRMQIEAASGKPSRAKKSSKVERTTSVDFDLFAAEDTPQ